MPLDLPLLLLLLQIVSSCRKQQKNSINAQCHIFFSHYMQSDLRLRMFLCSSSSAVGLWLNRLKRRENIYFRKLFSHGFSICVLGDHHYCIRLIQKLMRQRFVVSFLWSCILWIYSVCMRWLQSGPYSWVERLIVTENRSKKMPEGCKQSVGLGFASVYRWVTLKDDYNRLLTYTSHVWLNYIIRFNSTLGRISYLDILLNFHCPL